MQIIQMGMCCPHCGGDADDATASNSKATPTPGAIAVCFYCGAINKYAGQSNNLQLVEMRETELETLRKQDPETFELLKRWQYFIENRSEKE